MKLAACFNHKGDSTGIISRMAQSQCLTDSQKIDTYIVENGALACISASEKDSNVVMIRNNDRGNILIVSGTPIKLNGSLNVELGRAVDADYIEAGLILREMDGAFAALFWDAANKKALIVTDFLGLQPLYMYRNKNLVLVATELKAFPASGLVEVEMDPAGWGAFISFGHSIGNETQLADVVRCEAGVTMVYDPVGNRLDTTRYWQWPSQVSYESMEDVKFPEIIEIMRQEIYGYQQHNEGNRILLSGGYDSRLILSLLCQEKMVGEAIILSHRDELFGADSFIGCNVARAHKAQIIKIKPSKDSFNKPEYLNYAVMSDMAVPSMYLFIAIVSYYLKPGLQAVWEGTPLGQAFKFHFPEIGGFSENVCNMFRTNEDHIWRIAIQMFGRTKADQMYEAFLVSFNKEIAKYPDDECGLTMFNVYNRMRNRTAHNALKVYSNYVMPFMLGCSKEFWQHIGAISPRLKAGNRMYHKIFEYVEPDMLSLPFSHGGEIVCDASMGWKGRLVENAFRIANSRTFKRIQRKYRHVVNGSGRYWNESNYLRLTREMMDFEHVDLDKDGMRSLDIGYLLPFYWQMWRWVMEGRLTMNNTTSFLR